MSGTLFVGEKFVDEADDEDVDEDFLGLPRPCFLVGSFIVVLVLFYLFLKRVWENVEGTERTGERR